MFFASLVGEIESHFAAAGTAAAAVASGTIYYLILAQIGSALGCSAVAMFSKQWRRGLK